VVKPFAWLYRVLIANQIRQLTIPLDQKTLAGLDSWLDAIDLQNDGNRIFGFGCGWTRAAAFLYTSAHTEPTNQNIDGYDAAYVSVCFPIPGGSMTTVLVPLNYDGDGFMLRTRDRRSTESGVYLLLPHRRSFSMIPALGLAERFRLKADGEQTINVVHECFWLGMHAFTMYYRITRRKPCRA